MVQWLNIWTFGKNFVHQYSLRSVMKTYYFELGPDLALHFTTVSVFTGTSWKEWSNRNRRGLTSSMHICFYNYSEPKEKKCPYQSEWTKTVQILL